MTTATYPRTAEEYRAAVRDLIGELHKLEEQALGATGRRYREISEEMNSLEQLAITYSCLAEGLEKHAAAVA